MYSISIRPILENGLERTYEFFNDSSVPFILFGSNLVSLEDGKPNDGSLCFSFRGSARVRWKHQLENGVVSILSVDEEEQGPQKTLVVKLNRPKGPIALVIRTYQYGKVDQGRNQMGWYRIADTCFTLEELASGVSKPSFSRSDLFHFSEEQRRGFKGYDWISVSSNSKGAVKNVNDLFTGHPVDDLVLVSEYALREHLTLKNIPRCASHMNVPQYMHPVYYFVPGFPVIPALSPSDAFVTSAHSFYINTPAKVVTNEWILARLNEVLECRGISSSRFFQMTKEIHKGNDPGRDVFNIVNHVLRMHTCSRPYVVDHAWLSRQSVVRGDQESSAFHLPGDCEDSSFVVYKIHMQLLFGCSGGNPLIEALRTCAATLGVPVVISGTFLDPLKLHDPDECGHVFPCAIPFGVFARAIGGNLEDTRREFKRLFKFDLPLWHARIAVLEGVFRTTMFYGSQRHVSEKKKQAMETTKEWLFHDKHEDPDDFWCWEHYTCGLPLNLQHRAHGQAYRLFTGILDYAELGAPRYINGEKETAEHTPCCSFLFRSNLNEHSDVDEIFRTLFPEGVTGGEDTQKRVKEQIQGCKVTNGAGIPVDFLVGAQASLFSLWGITPLPRAVYQAETNIRSWYDRPIVPLPAYPKDYFQKKVEIPPFGLAPPKGVLNSNTRVIIYAYDVNWLELEKLKQRLGAKIHYTARYAFSTAVIIPLV
jgi:hypothetical protein